jgi:hypothetical protein
MNKGPLDRYLNSAILTMACIVMVLIIVLALMVGQARCQVPEAPQPVTQHCFRGTTDAQGYVSEVEVDCSTIPQWRELKPILPKKVGFFTIRPNRTNKQTLVSPWFWGVQSVAWTLTIRDYVKNRNTQESGRLDATDAFVPTAALTGTHYASDRWWARAIGVAAESYLIAWHAHGLATGKWH